MLELMLCSMLTLLPDYLVRRYVQGKRIGYEITLFSVWYELRWGITLCLILTVLLITIVLYHHPSSTNVNSLFRTISIFPEIGGRVEAVYVGYNDMVKKGDPLFKMDTTRQQAAVETARARIAEVDAAMATAKADVLSSEGKLSEAKGAYEQALDELRTKTQLQQRNPDIVAAREIEKLQTLVATRQGAVDSAAAAKESVETRVVSVLPAQKASAQAELAAATVELEKMTTYASVDGRVDQFVLRVGDLVQPAPVTRAAGILIPAGAGEDRLLAGFNQIEAQVLKVGMAAEATCISKPMTIIPLVVTRVQDVIAAGQILQTNQLTDLSKIGPPGTVLAFLEPLYPGVLDDVPPGSSCIANVYSNHHDEILSKDTGSLKRVYLHLVDTVALVHALVLRLQATVLPLKALVFGGH
ncbi:MAG: HlyD family secretion protein [Bradyrhizobium sp.]|uniref:HlyD family secretion protein n=1 Tax=Bradyrhizobium sp. TaxID=376 RepID=UPI0025C068AE|nr:biotin/lipoyl-binding protein [Bradyrhizobium sp.]MBI5260679.1 HlyD family secretion protein [Bradyrhizobium sp.]